LSGFLGGIVKKPRGYRKVQQFKRRIIFCLPQGSLSDKEFSVRSKELEIFRRGDEIVLRETLNFGTWFPLLNQY